MRQSISSLLKNPYIKIVAIIVLVASPLLIALIIVSPSISSPIKLTGKPQIIVSCPVAEQLCPKGQTLEMSLPENKKKYDGLGWMLPEKTNIFAAFDGNFKEQNVHGLPSLLRIITLTSTDSRIEARYFFVPEKRLTVLEQLNNANGKTVKKGDVLVNIPGTSLEKIGYKEANLQFFVINKKDNQKTVRLKIEDLGNIRL